MYYSNSCLTVGGHWLVLVAGLFFLSSEATEGTDPGSGLDIQSVLGGGGSPDKRMGVGGSQQRGRRAAFSNLISLTRTWAKDFAIWKVCPRIGKEAVDLQAIHFHWGEFRIYNILETMEEEKKGESTLHAHFRVARKADWHWMGVVSCSLHKCLHFPCPSPDTDTPDVYVGIFDTETFTQT